MGVKALSWAWEAHVGSHTRKLILIALADWADDNGYCWPSYDTIARKCEISRRAVVMGIKRLQDDNLILLEKRHDSSGFQSSNRYKLSLSASPAPLSLSAYDDTSRGASPTPNTSLKHTSVKTNKKLNGHFSSFWESYPRKKSKGAAEKAWIRINPDGELTKKIVEAVKSATVSWDDPKFIPYPATWLNGKGWEDEQAMPKKRNRKKVWV